MWFNRVTGLLTCLKYHYLANGMADRNQLAPDCCSLASLVSILSKKVDFSTKGNVTVAIIHITFKECCLKEIFTK